MNTKLFLQRAAFTFVVATLGGLGGAALFQIDAWKAAVEGGISTVITSVVTWAQFSLDSLPTPQGLMFPAKAKPVPVVPEIPVVGDVDPAKVNPPA